MRLSLPFIHQAFRPALTGTGNRCAFHGEKFDNMADQSFIVVHELTEDFDLENELFEDEDDLMILSAVSCFMRRDLNRIQDYFEVTVPSYAPSEFRSHFRMTRGTCEILCREIMNTGKIPARNTRERLPIPPVKQVLAFLWSMANQEPTRLVADRFNITMSSVDRVLHRGTRALADISAESYQVAKWYMFLSLDFICLFVSVSRISFSFRHFCYYEGFYFWSLLHIHSFSSRVSHNHSSPWFDIYAELSCACYLHICFIF